MEHQPDSLPDRYEAGTPNVSGIAGLGAAVNFILNEGIAKIHKREAVLTVGYLLDTKYGIMVRTGLHCAPCAHKTIGTVDRGTIRIGIGYFNTKEDIDCLWEALKDIIKHKDIN